MPSRRLDIKIRIILFLLCTVGILYITMRLLYRNYEGFQASGNCSYNTSLFPGKSVYLCPTDDDATGLFSDVSLNLNSNDGVCYKASDKFYTCYQRPPATNFDFTSGVYVQIKHIDDTSPDDAINNMEQICATSNAENLRISTIYQSTLAYQKGVTGVINTISNAVSQLSNISTSYCTGISASDPKYNFCTTLNTGIGNFKNLPTGDGGLNSMSNTLASMATNINSLYTDTFQRAYTGYKC